MSNYETLKTFRVDVDINQRFKEECAKRGLAQGHVLERLMHQWIRFKGSAADKRDGNIYNNGREEEIRDELG